MLWYVYVLCCGRDRDCGMVGIDVLLNRYTCTHIKKLRVYEICDTYAQTLHHDLYNNAAVVTGELLRDKDGFLWHKFLQLHCFSGQM